MKFIALGSNLASAHGRPVENLRVALRELSARGFEIIQRAPLYITTPVPKSDQPDFVNTVVQVEFSGTPEVALKSCLDIETAMGRVRMERNAARMIDLDVIAWDDITQSGPPELPHPRMQERAFVMFPLNDIAPEWRHPVLQLTAIEIKSRLSNSGIRLSEEQW